MQTMHLDYVTQFSIVSPIERWLFNLPKEIHMTLVYVMIGFTGLAGAAIAKDSFVKLEAPRIEASKK